MGETYTLAGKARGEGVNRLLTCPIHSLYSQVLMEDPISCHVLTFPYPHRRRGGHEHCSEALWRHLLGDKSLTIETWMLPRKILLFDEESLMKKVLDHCSVTTRCTELLWSFCHVMGKAMNIAKQPPPGLDFIVPKLNLGSLTSVHLL